MRKICIFTSTRAEWGLLRRVAELVRKPGDLQLQLLVSGSHLSEKHGMTVREIEADGFPVDLRVNILRYDDSPVGICQTMGLAISGYGEALEQLKPEVLVLLGDRYETFCAAAAAQIQRIPVAHIHGGETTEGAVDEAFRHSITKMAHLHFPCCEVYRQRIIQLGEHPDRVFNVGSLGTENIRRIPLLSRAELGASLGFHLDQPFFLVTFHPVTLETHTAGKQCEALLQALDNFPDHQLIITHANADPDGLVINEMMAAYVQQHPTRCRSISSLGLVRYLSAMNLCAAVVGNSSSGILETPAFKKPTVNIGDRQKGRVQAANIINCTPDSENISQSIKQALSPEFANRLQGMKNPFDQGDTARRIVDIISAGSLDGLLKKTFFDQPGG